MSTGDEHRRQAEAHGHRTGKSLESQTEVCAFKGDRCKDWPDLLWCKLRKTNCATDHCEMTCDNARFSGAVSVKDAAPPNPDEPHIGELDPPCNCEQALELKKELRWAIHNLPDPRRHKIGMHQVPNKDYPPSFYAEGWLRICALAGLDPETLEEV